MNGWHFILLYLGGGFKYFPYLGKISNLTNIFQMGWSHQPVMVPFSRPFVLRSHLWLLQEIPVPLWHPKEWRRFKSPEVFFFPIILGNKQSITGWWFHFFIFPTIWGRFPILTVIFQMGWNHQLYSQLQMDKWISDHTSPKAPAEIW